jgi:predicted dithiol-disulfide oxidoreductase (DUF899 family)
MKQKLAELRRQMDPQKVKDYRFEGPWGESISLSQLFGKQKELIVIHNMGHQCPYCTLWADEFSGILKHIEDRAAFVVESMDPPETQREFSADRGWKFKMVSSRSSTFRKDMGYGKSKSSLVPGLSVFRKERDGSIVRVSDTQFGPGDNFCSLWDLFDMLPDSNSNWRAKFSYFK